MINQPGELEVSWDAPAQTTRGYRLSWARVGEGFKPWTDLTGNAFPTGSSYTITGLDQSVRYKVKVRARYDEGPLEIGPRRLKQLLPAQVDASLSLRQLSECWDRLFIPAPAQPESFVSQANGNLIFSRRLRASEACA